MAIKKTGIVEYNGKPYCNKCGNDLTVDGSVTCLFHWDGIDDYGMNYVCNRCDNPITITIDRDDNDKF